MLFSPSSSLFFENNARNTKCMPVLIFKKCLDLRKNFYPRTSSYYQDCLAAHRSFTVTLESQEQTI